MDWMLMPLRRYADFSGRSRRMEYWMFILALLIVYTIIFVIAGVLGASSMSSDGTGVAHSGMLGGSIVMIGLFLLIALAVFIPSLAVQVRRFHDQNQSGWLALLNLIPYLGGLVVLVFMCLPGTVGPNKYGPDPLEAERGGVGPVIG